MPSQPEQVAASNQVSRDTWGPGQEGILQVGGLGHMPFVIFLLRDNAIFFWVLAQGNELATCSCKNLGRKLSSLVKTGGFLQRRQDNEKKGSAVGRATSMAVGCGRPTLKHRR